MNTIKHGSNTTAYRGVALSALTAILAARCAPVDEMDSHASQPTVYGADDRQDVYAHGDIWMQSLARQATTALMYTSAINTTNPNNVTFNGPTLGDGRNLCATERFRDDPTAAHCSGTLIDDDLVLTAGHCIDASRCADTRFVFNYYRDSATALHTVTTSDIFSCASVVARRLDVVDGHELDYAVVRLDRRATPRFTPAPVRRSSAALTNGQRLGIIGFGAGLPAKIDTGGTVRDARASTLDYFVATTDSFAGSSGSGVWELGGYEIAGILVRGEVDYRANGACNVVNTCTATGCRGEGVTYVRPALDALCAATTSARLCSPPAAPVNDSHGRATALPLGVGETTVTGTTLGATRDGPSVPCTCTSGGNVWYRFSLTQREVVYLDTAGSSFDTSLFITDANGMPVRGQAGNNLPGLCNDDAACVSGGFSSWTQSRTAGVLNPGTYYVSVGGCSTGNFTLHLQHMPTSAGSYFYPAQFSGDGTTTARLVFASAAASTCGGTGSGEDVRWFVSCGAQPQLFSLCQGDGGAFTRQSGSNTYDPVMYLRSAQTGSDVTCNDDGPSASNCVGTGGDARPYGSRLASVTVPRGLNALFVDSRTGGPGMIYSLRYTVR